MRHSRWAVIVFAAFLAAVGGAGKSQAQQSAGPDKAAALVAAGFKMVPANTPERQAALSQLPPQKVVRRLRGDKVVFLYADPANCNCLYAGNLTAYTTYQARVLDKVAEEQANTRMENWDPTPWAFGFPED
jgi:hypothetical protein